MHNAPSAGASLKDLKIEKGASVDTRVCNGPSFNGPSYHFNFSHDSVLFSGFDAEKALSTIFSSETHQNQASTFSSSSSSSSASSLTYQPSFRENKKGECLVPVDLHRPATKPLRKDEVDFSPLPIASSSEDFLPSEDEEKKSEEKLVRLAIGNSNFRAVRENRGTIIDKSLLIKEIIDDGSQVKLIVRPRRFGKTFNMYMLECFFNRDSNNGAHLFKNLAIWKQGKHYQDEYAAYPVIFITLKDINKPEFDVRMLISY